MLSSRRISSRRASTPASAYVITRPCSDMTSFLFEQMLKTHAHLRSPPMAPDCSPQIQPLGRYAVPLPDRQPATWLRPLHSQATACGKASLGPAVSTVELRRGFYNPCQDRLRDGPRSDKFCIRSEWGRHPREHGGSPL